VVTDSLVSGEPETNAARTTVRLMAKKGNIGVSETFAVLPRALPNFPGVTLPESWPNVSSEELLKLVRGSLPNSFVAYDGEKVTAGRFLRGRMDLSAGTNIDRYTAQSLVNVASFVWPNTGAFQRFTPQTKIRLISDEEGHPGLVGIELSYLGPSNDFYVSQTVYWLDPKQDDVMIDSSETEFKGGSVLNKTSMVETHTTEVGKLPDGRCYPARWTVTSRKPSADGFLDPYLTRECRLVLALDAEIDTPWVEKPATVPASGPAARAVPGTKP
jgi:hypothetical protein